VGVWAHAVAGEQATAGADRGLLASDLFAPLSSLIRSLVADDDRAPRR
jgi:NAD(P)H-hydrate repair Nnr-like enzyme with NAD(P)H-hydrate dehydratase domain